MRKSEAETAGLDLEHELPAGDGNERAAESGPGEPSPAVSDTSALGADLQKIKAVSKQEKRTYEVGEVSGLLKALAVQTGVALVTIAQLNREPAKDKTRAPQLSDLADSGQIERDADGKCVWFGRIVNRLTRQQLPTHLERRGSVHRPLFHLRECKHYPSGDVETGLPSRRLEHRSRRSPS